METHRIVVPEAEEIIGKYFPVLDHGFVALRDYMGGDLAIEESARISYGKGTRKTSDTRNLLRYLFRCRHLSPFEMVHCTLHLGLPIFIMRQLVRHRTAQMNEYSGRYSTMPMIFYTPKWEQVCHQSKKNKQGRGESLTKDEYGDFRRKLQTERGVIVNHYHEWVNEDDIAREIARIDLPMSTYTYCYWKCDLRNLFNFVSLRSDSHAQWEMQQYSDVICGIIQRLCPISFAAFRDYQQTAVTFSQIEMMAIRLISHYHVSPVAWESPSEMVREEVVRFLSEEGYTKREIDEFWEKLKYKSKKDYSLDVSRAKSAEYFREMIEEA